MAGWDYQLHGGVYRDVQEEGIEQLIRRGELSGDDKVAVSGTDRWTALCQVPAFQAAIRRSNDTDRSHSPLTLPNVGSKGAARFYYVWFLVTLGFSIFSWHQAESYNPEGNGMFNLVEASLSNQAWLQVIAAVASAIFSSLFLAAGIIVSRLRDIAEINRAGHLAIIEELRRGR